MCGTKNFVSVRLYSAPQSHWMIVAIFGICAFGDPVQAGSFARGVPPEVRTNTACRGRRSNCYRSPAKKRLLRWLATSAQVRDAQNGGFDLISSFLGEQRQDTVGDMDSNDV